MVVANTNINVYSFLSVNQISYDTYEFDWGIRESVTKKLLDSSCLILGTQSMKFAINSGPNCLKQNYNYTISVDLFYPGTGISLNSDSLKIFVVSPPYKGKVTVFP